MDANTILQRLAEEGTRAALEAVLIGVPHASLGIVPWCFDATAR
jgi:hypothetical protein